MGKNGILTTTIIIEERITDDAPTPNAENLENFRNSVYESITQDVDMDISEVTVTVTHSKEEK